MAIIRKNVPRNKTKRMLNATETKNTLFQTALKLFANFGYDKVTVDEITSRAGVSKGTFYNHFESKESILVEQFRKIDEHYDEVFANVPEDASAREQLLLLISAMTHYCTDICGIEFMRVVYASQVNANSKAPILNNHKRRIYDYLRRIVTVGKASGEIRSSLPDEELVELLMRACRSLIYDWCLYGESMDVAAEGQRYFEILFSWLSRAE